MYITEKTHLTGLKTSLILCGLNVYDHFYEKNMDLINEVYYFQEIVSIMKTVEEISVCILFRAYKNILVCH